MKQDLIYESSDGIDKWLNDTMTGQLTGGLMTLTDAAMNAMYNQTRQMAGTLVEYRIRLGGSPEYGSRNHSFHHLYLYAASVDRKAAESGGIGNMSGADEETSTKDLGHLTYGVSQVFVF